MCIFLCLDLQVFRLYTQFVFHFQALKSEIFTFIGKELKKIQRVLSSDCPEDLENQLEDGDLLEDEDKDERRSTRDAVVKITMYFLMRMKQERLADCLQKSKQISLKT